MREQLRPIFVEHIRKEALMAAKGITLALSRSLAAKKRHWQAENDVPLTC